MAGVGHRHAYNEDVVAFPASKTAGATTITGTMVYDFEASGWGGAQVMFIVGDTADVGDTIQARTYVSFTEGDTTGSANWVEVDGDTASSFASDSTSFRELFIPFAPRIRVDVTFDGAATLAAGHGCQVDILALEYDPEAARTVFEDTGNFGDSYLGGDSADGDTMEISYPTKLYIWFNSDGVIGDTAYTVTLQGSQDASNWFTITTLSTAVPTPAATAAWANTWEIVERPDFPRYARIRTVFGDSETPISHGMKYYVMALE